MRLSELLVPQHVVIPLDAPDKWQAITALAAATVRSGAMPAQRLTEVEQALTAREKSMTTGMEHGVAIPHAAVEGIPEVLAVLGLSPAGIPFEALDGQPARILVCLIIPRQKKLLHIKTLAEIARILSRPAVRENLLSCNSADEVLACIQQAEGG